MTEPVKEPKKPNTVVAFIVTGIMIGGLCILAYNLFQLYQ